MIWGLGILCLGIILITIGSTKITNNIVNLCVIITGIIFTALGFALSISLPISATCTDENKLIITTPVEWVTEKNAFKEVEVSNTILKIYSSRNWFTNVKDGERYTVLEKGITVLDGVKYEKVIEHYSLHKTSEVFVSE